jgi:hypothetical protein
VMHWLDMLEVALGDALLDMLEVALGDALLDMLEVALGDALLDMLGELHWVMHCWTR